MKKLSKKQKLIGFIAILIVAVIIAIVITTSIIKNNKQVASEGYSLATANADSEIIANYIKKGITIGGVTGKLESLNTFDATATAEDIALGKTAYVNGKKITGMRIETVAQGKESQKVFEENTVLIDDYGNKVKVPEGFKISEDSATGVTGGVVIEDVTAKGVTEYTKGSQFVWIPIGDVIKDTNGNKVTISLGRYTFASDGTKTLVQLGEEWNQELPISPYYRELVNSNYGNSVAKSLGDFANRTINSGGYYLGRYEAGDATATNLARTDSTSDSNPIVSKSGVYPYNYITQSQASNLCRGMYNSNNFESDLINSYAWDTAIVFIQEFSGDINYSRASKLQDTLAKCGEATDGKNNDVRCNIYDMAGNTCEWTTEASSNPYAAPLVYRGGGYDGYYTSDRNFGGITHSHWAWSARIILYL